MLLDLRLQQISTHLFLTFIRLLESGQRGVYFDRLCQRACSIVTNTVETKAATSEYPIPAVLTVIEFT